MRGLATKRLRSGFDDTLEAARDRHFEAVEAFDGDEDPVRAGLGVAQVAEGEPVAGSVTAPASSY